MSVFRTLMATRATDLNSERVAALNLIQIEFANNPDVLQAWSGLLQHFGGPDAANEEEAKRFGRERTRLTTVLLDKMARRLGIRVEQLDILEGVYHPRGFWQIEQEQQALRRLLLEIAGPTGYHGRACAARDGRAAARRLIFSDGPAVHWHSKQRKAPPLKTIEGALLPSDGGGRRTSAPSYKREEVGPSKRTGSVGSERGSVPGRGQESATERKNRRPLQKAGVRARVE